MPTQILPIGIEPQPSFLDDDRIFLGEGLFETIRVDEQQACYPLHHWQRMYQSANLLGIPFDLSFKTWLQQLAQCISIAQIKTGGIKVILSGGSAPRGLDARGDTSSILFKGFRYKPQRSALRLVRAPWLRDANNPIYQLKSVNYLESIMARRHALSCGADDALFFNLKSHLCETTIANIFLVMQGQLFTPSLEDGVLAGIIRGRLLNLCDDLGIACNETALDSSMLRKADAVFVTNVLQGIRSVKSMDGHPVPTHHPLITQLRQLLAKDSRTVNTT